MGQVHVNPDDLDRFARELRQFSAELQTSMKGLQSQFSRLGETWQDSEHQKYAQEFTSTMQTLRRFIDSSEQQVGKLQKKAELIRRFLGK